MPNSPFSTDFGFRRGTEEKFNRTAIQDGSINICVDTGNLYIDIDGQRISTRDITIKDTEAEIYALPAPNPRIYFARDTYNLLYFDTKLLIWRIVGSEHAKYSDLAIGDSEGHKITEWYETIANSNSKIATVNADIEYLRNMISQISSFEIVVLDSADDLPEIGQPHTVYFVPQEDSDQDTQFDEFIWLEEEEYYEKIGITKPDLTDYYKKTETNDLLDGLKTELEGEVGDTLDNITSVNEDLQATKGHLSSTIEAVTNLQGVVGGNNTDSIERDEALGASITALDGKVNDIIGDETISLDDINLKSLADKDAAIVGDDTLDLSVTNIASLKEDVDDHETRITALEEGGGGGGGISDLQEQIDSIKGDNELDLNAINLKSLKDAIDLISDTSGGSIAELVGRVNSNESNISTLRSDVDTLQAETSDLSNDYSEYKSTNNTRVSNVQSTLQSNITSVNNTLTNHIDSCSAKDDDLQDQIDALETTIDSVGRFKCVIVDYISELPVTGENGTLYFVADDPSDPDNTRYGQYVWLEDEETYHLIGLTTVDLTNYYTKSEVATMVNSVFSSIGFNQGWVSVNGTGDAVVDFGMD